MAEKTFRQLLLDTWHGRCWKAFALMWGVPMGLLVVLLVDEQWHRMVGFLLVGAVLALIGGFTLGLVGEIAREKSRLAHGTPDDSRTNDR